MKYCSILGATCPELKKEECTECELKQVYDRYWKDSRMIEVLIAEANEYRKGKKDARS